MILTDDVAEEFVELKKMCQIKMIKTSLIGYHFVRGDISTRECLRVAVE